MVDFQKQVIERSHTIPVLVDFWAEWCGPCRMLGPVLEQLADEQKDKWELLKVNTEEQQDLAQEFGIRSIPNVKLFYGGKVIGEFAGALPKFQLEQWLKTNLPDPCSGELDAILSQTEFISGTELESKLRQFVAQHSENEKARIALAHLLVFSRASEVQEILQGILPGDESFEAADDLRTLGRLMLFDLENGSPVASHLAAARNALAAGDEETAIKNIIEANMADKNFRNDLPRKSAIALFHIWGNNHDLTRKYRRSFDMALY